MESDFCTALQETKVGERSGRGGGGPGAEVRDRDFVSEYVDTLF